MAGSVRFVRRAFAVVCVMVLAVSMGIIAGRPVPKPLQVALAVPATTTSTASTTSTSTTTTTSASTSTTTSTTPPPTTSTTSTTTPTPVPHDTTAESPSTTVAPDRCASALADVEAGGLAIAPGFAFNCPASGVDYDGSAHEGLTSFGGSLAGCAPVHVPLIGCYVDVNVDRIGSSDARLRHVIAHELCHTHDYAVTGTTTEEGADACAASYGF